MDLLPHCGPDDIITPTGDYSGQNHRGWDRHEAGRTIKERVGEDIWNSYFVFAMDRNPWDKVASNYWYKRGYNHNQAGLAEKVSLLERILRNSTGYPWSINSWLKYRAIKESLTRYERPRLPRGTYWYTDKEGNPIIDCLLRFESRNEHMSYIADRLQLKFQSLSNQGTHTRKSARNYQDEYSEWSKRFIADYFKKDLKLLNYKFGEEPPRELIHFPR